MTSWTSSKPFPSDPGEPAVVVGATAGEPVELSVTPETGGGRKEADRLLVEREPDLAALIAERDPTNAYQQRHEDQYQYEEWRAHADR